MAVDHYENFPVASLLLPARLRKAVQDIYRFARTADDIADEGSASDEERLRQLQAYRLALDAIEAGNPQAVAQALKPVFLPLAETIRRHALPVQPFRDLLSAFEQDVDTTRYASDAQLLDYCRRSADPVGRLLLHLYERVDDETLYWADSICTGLQLTNFWQDIAIDWSKGRVYIPQDTLSAYNVTEAFLGTHTGRTSALPRSPAWEGLMARQVKQARALLQQGMPLCWRLPARAGFELRLVIMGGLRILERLDQLNYDVFFQRPVLRKRDWLHMFWRACTLSRSDAQQAGLHSRPS